MSDYDPINDFRGGDWVGYLFLAYIAAIVIIIFVECI